MTDLGTPRNTVVAIVPAKDRADSVGATVTALLAVASVDRVLVVDDGSADDTSGAARGAGAEVLRLGRNLGKADAVLAGVDATPDADVYLLIDADVAGDAALATSLLTPVLDDEADLVIGVLPAAGTRGGFGKVRDLARRGIKRASGFEAAAPLSGQRAVRAHLLRQLTSASRFGLEVAMTIDAARAGARVREVEVEMEHRHTGRTVAGFTHRAGQGVDIVRALIPRVTSRRQRLGAGAAVVVVLLLVGLWGGSQWEPSSTPLPQRADKVVVFGVSPLSFSDLGRGDTPVLDRLVAHDAVAAMSVRTVRRTPTAAEGYLAIGAGYRVSAPAGSDEAYDTSTALANGTAADLFAARTGRHPGGAVAAVGATRAVDANDSDTISSKPGALADALHEAHKTTAVVGNADLPDPVDGTSTISRPAALAAISTKLTVDHGTVDAADLLRSDPVAPFGVRADPAKTLDAVRSAMRTSDLVVVDPGDLERADAARTRSSQAADRRAKSLALRRTDALLGKVIAAAGPHTLVLVVSLAPSAGALGLTPMVAVGAGAPHGYVSSPSTKRDGIVAITDVAPTVLGALGVPIPDDMPGHALRYHAGDVDLASLKAQDRDTTFREATYYDWSVWFIRFEIAAYALTALMLTRRKQFGRAAPWLRWAMLAGAAFPLATFVYRAVPGWSSLAPAAAMWALVGLTAAVTWLAGCVRRRPLSGLGLIMGATLAILAVDVCTGSWLHVNSWLGYSLHSGGRFYGIPNTTFALLAGGALLLGAMWLQHASRRDEALWAVGALLVLTIIVDGAPSLGGDVGGILTLVPIFGLAFLAFTGRRFRVRSIVLVVVTALVLLCAATAVDLMRPTNAQTHLGRFANRLFHDGPSALSDTVLRKQSANVRILGGSVWSTMLPLVIVFLLFVLVWQARWNDVLPKGSALRIGAVATALGALLGFATNDSGPIVVALFGAYLLPFVGLLAIAEPLDPVLLEPTGSPPGSHAADEPVDA